MAAPEWTGNLDALAAIVRHSGRGTRMLAASSMALRQGIESMHPPAPCTFNLSADMLPGLTEIQRRDAALVQLHTESLTYTLTEIELPGFALDPTPNPHDELLRGGPRLAAVLQRCPGLEYLNLRDCRSVLVWQEIALALPACTSLERVDLSNTRHGGPHSVFEGLRQCPSLTDLDLRDCDLRVMANSVARVMQVCPALRRLNLSGNRLVTREGMYCDDLGLVLQHCPRLEHLDLSNNGLDNEAMGWLLGGFRLCHSLQHLNLADNNLRSVEVRQLSQCLDQVRTLQQLNLRNNSIGLDGLRSLATFRICQRMTYLNLSRCFHGPEAHEFVAELARCARLRHLDLSHNRLSDRFTQLLMRALPQCAALTHLDLASNYITRNCVDAIKTAIERCPLLERLNLSDNEFTPADRDRLRAAWSRKHGDSGGLWCA